MKGNLKVESEKLITIRSIKEKLITAMIIKAESTVKEAKKKIAEQ